MDLWIVFGVLFAALVLFVTEAVSIDLTALMIMASLILTGVLTPEEGISGLSNPAPVTVAAVLVLGAGLIRTGAVEKVGRRLSAHAGTGEMAQMLVIFISVGIMSAFINNTAAVAMSIPLVLGIARERGISPSKLLMPLSFAAILGGVCTYVGTSTNIIVGSILRTHGFEPFRMFEFSRLGIIFLVLGLAYMMTFGRKLLPIRRAPEATLTEDYRLRDYLTELVVLEGSHLVGKTLQESDLSRARDIDVLEIRRDKANLGPLLHEVHLEVGDMLIVKGNLDKVMRIRDQEGVDIHPTAKLSDRDLEGPEVRLAEGIISPGSQLIGKTLKEADFRKRFQATAMAIRRHGEEIREKLGRVRLEAGDMLLIQGRKERLRSLKDSHDFLLIMDDVQPTTFRNDKMGVAIAIFLGVIGAATFDLVPIMVAALCGSVLLVVCRCLTIQEAYEAVEWRIILLIAGTLTLGKALEKTGGAELIAVQMIEWVGPFGPVAVLSALYLLTMVMTEMMSNNATAALLTPIALSVAGGLSLDPRPFAICVAFAASASFLSPIGYQTNTLVYGPGGYRFTDYMRFGFPISLSVWLLATLLIPVFWPF